jgi:tetratricopeptide (TPR) repeat protein
MVCADQWPPRPEPRDRIALRALRVLEGLVQPSDLNGHADYLRGQAFRIMERHGEAVDHLQLAAEQDPTNIHVWLALGWCYKRISRLDLAIQSLEEGLAIDPDQGILHYNLACYWSLAHNSRLALEYLAQSIDLDPIYRKLVRTEPDFDPIRDDPDFMALASPTPSS